MPNPTLRSFPFAFAFAATLAPTLASQATTDQVAAIQREGLEKSEVMAHLDYLTNTIGHRLTGSDSFTRACEWTRARFASWGLDARLEPWDEWPRVWSRGQWQGRIVEPVEMELHVATEAWTGGTGGRVRAEMLRMPMSTGRLVESGREELAGKWVVARRLPRTEKLKALVDAGVAGIVFSSRGDDAYPNRMRVFGDRRHPAWRQAMVQVMVRKDQFDTIWRLLRRAAGEKVVAEFDLRNRVREEPIALHNVIADIRGSEFPDEYVIVCGHLDSWHQATGATDNGTGAATTLEAARILAAAGVQPRRTIRFILWGGEEQGLLGSIAYVKRHRQEMRRVSCVLNHDSGTNWAYGLTVAGEQYEDMLTALGPVMAMPAPEEDHSGPVFELRRVARLGGGGGGSDHASFLAVGVPGLPWRLRGRADYFRFSWHSQWDTYDVAIPEYQRHTATVIALTALGVANLPHLLGRGAVADAGPRADAQPVLEARLGISLKGMEITEVQAKGLAGAAGARVGDVIHALDGVAVDSAVQVVSRMRGTTGPWRLGVRRDGQERELRLGSGPAEADAKPRTEAGAVERGAGNGKPR